MQIFCNIFDYARACGIACVYDRYMYMPGYGHSTWYARGHVRTARICDIINPVCDPQKMSF
jgi:hypothetical protein